MHINFSPKFVVVAVLIMAVLVGILFYNRVVIPQRKRMDQLRAVLIDSASYRWRDPSELKMASSGEYTTVTADGVEYYCERADTIAGFPLCVIMHRGDDMMIIRANTSLAIEER